MNKIKEFLNKYVFESNNKSHSYCRDCGHDFPQDLNKCPECKSERRSVNISITESIVLGGSSKNVLRENLRESFCYITLHLSTLPIIIYFFVTTRTRIITEVNTLNWFFSTVTQAYIALVALLIAVATFRLQENNSERTNLGSRIRKQLVHFIHREADGMTTNDAIIHAKSMSLADYEREEDEIRANRIKDLVKQVKILEKSNRTIQKNIRKAFLASGTAATISLIFLVLVNYIHQIHLDVIAISLVLEAVLATTYFTWKLVKSLR